MIRSVGLAIRRLFPGHFALVMATGIVSIAVWLIVVGFGLSRISIQSIKGPALFVGLAMVLLENVRRTAISKKG